MTIYGTTIDMSYGFDIMCGSKVLRHFEGTPDGYAAAKAYAAQGRGRYIRYYGKKS